jgi:uncharacterized protein (UPF0335 family)
MSEREKIASDAKPLFTERRSVGFDGGGPTLKHTIPEQAVALCDVDNESEAVIEIYSDGYIVRFE